MSGCAVRSPDSAPLNPEPVTFETDGGIKIHLLQTGWVSVKERFRELRVPGSLRIPSIITNTRWTEWMPIQFYVIEHPEGHVVFDTGETARVTDSGYFNCDRLTSWFYKSQLRFSVKPQDELGPQLNKVGIDPDSVRWTVLSHLHSDHIGGLEYLTNSEVLISERDSNGHPGALMCRLPENLPITKVTYTDGEFGAFSSSRAFEEDKNIRIVSTPGHTSGHQSLMLLSGDNYYLFGGDVVFDFERLNSSRALAGIVENITAAESSIASIRKQMSEYQTVLLSSHDHNVRRGAHTH